MKNGQTPSKSALRQKLIDAPRISNIQIINLECNEREFCDAENFVKTLFVSNGYKAIPNLKVRPRGHPDFVFQKGDDTFYVEVKTQNDGIRISQINWYLKNTNKRIIIAICNLSQTNEIDITTIPIRMSTRDKLRARAHKNQTYDDLIIELLKE